MSRSQMLDQICMCLGGHAAEKVGLGEIYTGSSSDLKRATELCRRMVTMYGMSEEIGTIYLANDQEVLWAWSLHNPRRIARKSPRRLTGKWRRLLSQCYARAVKLLEDHRKELDTLVQALLERETLNRRICGADVRRATSPRGGSGQGKPANLRLIFLPRRRNLQPRRKSLRFLDGIFLGGSGASRRESGFTCAYYLQRWCMDTPEVAQPPRLRRHDVLAITDHDALGGADALRGQSLALQVIPGVELSLRDMAGLHLLGYGADARAAALRYKLDELSKARVERAAEMCRLLTRLGFPLSLQELPCQGTVGRAHIARAMVECGWVATVQEAFDRFLAEGAPAYVPGQRLSMAEALSCSMDAAWCPYWLIRH